MNDVGLTHVTYAIETDAFGATPLTLTSVRWAESLDEPYVAEVWVRVHDPNADVLALLGKDVVLLTERGSAQRRLCGLVGTVWEGEPGDDHVVARALVHPALFMLSFRRNTRIFQEQPVPDIVKTVLDQGLGAYGREVVVDLNGSYPTREHCVQYQESDLRFVERLLEEEGIFYSFQHDGEREVLVLRDDVQQLERAPSASDPIAYQPDNLQTADAENIKAFSLRHAHGPTSVVLREHDWTAAAPRVEDEERGEDAAGRDRESYEHGAARSVKLWAYDPGARAYQENDAARQKTRRLEELRQNELVGLGVSGVIGLAPGTTFEIVGHPHLGVDGEYYVTRVWHRDESHGRQGGQGDDDYHNRFECRRIDVPHRPRRRFEKPSIPSIQTARVTGPAGEEIHTDEHGRIKVQLHWDRDNPADETSSCWVRCEQDWAGAGWGFWWLPRIGMEVVVHFVDGDPDRPVVTGCVYDGENPTPYPLPDEKTKSTIKSNSSPGGGGFNELRFEDKAGSEEIYTHAQKDYDEVVLNDHTTTVHHDQTNEVDNDQAQTVGNDQTETIHRNQKMTVGGNRTVHVGGACEESVDGTETRHTVGDVAETFAANETRSVGGDLTETIVGAETRDVGANKQESVSGDHALTVAAGSTRIVAGSLKQDVTGGITEMAVAGYDITATEGMTVKTGGPTVWTALAGIQLMAPGGVTWVDGFDQWFGVEIIEVAPTSISDCGFKFEVCAGTAIGLFGLKCEQAGLEVGNVGIELRKDGAWVGTGGVEAQIGGVRKFLGGLISKGG